MTQAADLESLLVQVLELRDLLKNPKELANIRKAMDTRLKVAVHGHKRDPSDLSKSRLRKALLAQAMLCDLVGNNLGYQEARFGLTKKYGLEP